MKIAMIFRKLNVKGGTQRQGLSLANELRKLGHEITLYTFSYNAENCYPHLLKDFPVIELPKDSLSDSKRSRLMEKTGVPEVQRENANARALAMIMKDDFNVLNPHDQVAYKVGVYYKKLKKNVPVIWNMNDLPLKRWGYDRAKGCDDNFHQPWYKHLAYYFFDLYDKFAFIRHLDAITVVDYFNKDLIKRYLKLNAFTVRSGPDFEYFMFKEKLPPHGSIKILTSGILMPHRRFEDAIKALPILIEKGFTPTLTIIGDTDNDKKYFSRLQKLITDLNLESKVTFLGRVTDEELINAYQTHDVYTFQHHLQSDGLSPFEAAACGMPLLVSKTAGCHEVLKHKENALLINPKDPADYAEKIGMLLNDSVLYAKMAKNANAFVRSHFSWQKYAEGNLEVWEKAKAKGPQITLSSSEN